MITEIVFGFLLLLGACVGQRPATASICDFYAIQMFGGNTTDTQFRLMQSILALAFAGPTPSMKNVSADVTGIFNPGTFQGISVNLEPWFNGSIDSTNLNNQAVGINWLDGGGRVPLQSFLDGQVSSITFSNSTNEYHVFGCTQPKPAPPQVGGYLSLAYVHKFMDLNYTDIGHFIDQLTLSSVYWGFSTQDAQTLSTQMNAQYNVRCAPAVPNPTLGPQLYSLCQDESCPLAAPNADCAAYVNLGPSGVNTSPTSTGSASMFTPSTIAPTSTSATSVSTTSSSSSSSATAATKATSGASLSPGGIAGVAVAGTAILLAFIAALVWLFKKKKSNDPYNPNPSIPSYIAPSYTDHHASYLSGQTQRYTGPPLAEMESPKPGVTPQMANVFSA